MTYQAFDLVPNEDIQLMEYLSWVDESVSEAKFTSRCLSLFRQNDWAAYHVYDSALREDKILRQYARRSSRGFPDLHLIDLKTLEVTYAELKVKKNAPTTAQTAYLDALCLHHDTFLWYPRHWPYIVRYALRQDVLGEIDDGFWKKTKEVTSERFNPQ